MTAAAVLAEALNDTRDENLVMRTLLAMFGSANHDTLLALKDTQPLIIEMKQLVPPDTFSSGTLGKALAYAIFCTSRGLDRTEASTKHAFLASAGHGAAHRGERREGGDAGARRHAADDGGAGRHHGPGSN